MAIKEEDYKIMERLRRRVADLVDDPDTVEALGSRTTDSCASGPTSSETYLPAFNLPNVTLVDDVGDQGEWSS